MGGKARDYGKCNICDKSLTRTSKRCSACSEIYHKIKGKNLNEDENELVRLTKEKYNMFKKERFDRFMKKDCINVNRYKGGNKPKYITIIKLNKEEVL